MATQGGFSTNTQNSLEMSKTAKSVIWKLKELSLWLFLAWIIFIVVSFLPQKICLWNVILFTYCSFTYTWVLWGMMSVPMFLFDVSSSHLHNQDWSTMKPFFFFFLTDSYWSLKWEKKNLKELLSDMDTRSLLLSWTSCSYTHISL